MARRPRRTEKQTRELIMAAAVEHVSTNGLRATPSLSMEDIIAAADVPRATAYRLWPSREIFATDVLDRLARGQSTPTLDLEAIETAVHAVAAEVSAGAEGIEIVGMLMGTIIEKEFDLLVDSHPWRAFLAYETALSSIPDPDQRARLLNRLAENEERTTHGIALLYGRVAAALGLRPRAEDSLLLAAQASRVLARGLVNDAVRETSTPQRRHADRRCLRESTSDLLRAALDTEEGSGLPSSWPNDVITEIRAEFDRAGFR